MFSLLRRLQFKHIEKFSLLLQLLWQVPYLVILLAAAVLHSQEVGYVWWQASIVISMVAGFALAFCLCPVLAALGCGHVIIAALQAMRYFASIPLVLLIRTLTLTTKTTLLYILLLKKLVQHPRYLPVVNLFFSSSLPYRLYPLSCCLRN
ncbi:MAG: hypothetical protein GY850_21700 [bacterium]|nr:hypothetical protein [bacterium]